LKDRAKAIMSLLANLKVESSDEWSEAWEEEIIERTRRFRESAEDLRGAAAKTRTEVGPRVFDRCIRRTWSRSVDRSLPWTVEAVSKDVLSRARTPPEPFEWFHLWVYL
jgi:hypothetical protein